MDLVLINDAADVPICKLLNFEKFIYEEKKAEKKKEKKQNVTTKEFQFKYGIAENDIKNKIRNAEKHMEKGHNVILSIIFNGRACVFIGDDYQMHVDKLLKELTIPYTFVSQPKVEGYKINLTIKKKG